MNILIACFEGDSNGAYSIFKNLKNIGDRLLLSNHKEKSCIQLDEATKFNKYNKIIILGQKPIIKDKLCIERSGKVNEEVLFTNFDFRELVEIFEKHHVNYVLSNNAGTSYCNNIYYWSLKNLSDIEVLFLHTPYLKRITSLNQMSNAIDEYIEKHYIAR